MAAASLQSSSVTEWPLGDVTPLEELLSVAADTVEGPSAVVVLDLGGDALMPGPKVCGNPWLAATAEHWCVRSRVSG